MAGPSVQVAGGAEAFWELHPHWNLRLGAFAGPGLGHLPVSLAYVFSGDYPMQLRPRVEVGGDLAFGEGLAAGLHVGAGIEYVFDNQWLINAGLRAYGGQTLSWLTPWTLFLNLGAGLKF